MPGVEGNATSETDPVTKTPKLAFLPRQAAFQGILSMILAIAVSFGCDGSTSERNADGGSGVDVPNSLHARLLANGNCRVDGVQVRVRPALWTPLLDSARADWNTTSSTDGSFTVTLTDSGAWVLEARDTIGGCGTLRRIDRDSLQAKGPRLLDGLVLEKFGAIEGNLATVAGTDSASNWSIVIPGVDVAITPDSDGKWRIELLAAGSYAPIAVFKGASEQASLGQIQVSPAATTLAAPTVVQPTDGTFNRIIRGRGIASSGAWASRGDIRLFDISGSSLPRRDFVMDDSGRYAFALPDTGRWLLLATSGGDVFADTLEPADLSTRLEPTKARFSTITFGNSGSVSGAILMPIGVGTTVGDPARWTLTLEGVGTRTSVRAGTSGQYLFTGLASGAYSLRASNAGTSNDTTLGTVEVASRTTTMVPPTTITSGMADPSLEWIEGRTWTTNGIAARSRIVALPESVGIVTSASKRQQILISTLGMTGTADDSGRFSLERPRSLPYQLVVTDPSGTSGKAIPWGNGTDTSILAALHLDPLGAARLRLKLPSGLPVSRQYSGFTWNLLGTTRGISTSPQDLGAPIVLDSLPPGEYKSVLLDVNNGTSLPFKFGVKVTPGGWFDSAIEILPSHLEDSSDWASEVRVEVFPPVDVKDVPNFVLRVRLDSYVDFSSSASDGHDIRILDSKGRWLPVHLSRWDSASHRAEAWVLLDTLHGDHSTELTVRSGNRMAARLSTFSSDSVFRRRDGWIGVWSGSDGRSLMSGTGGFELAEVGSDSGFSSTGMRFDSLSRAVARLPENAIERGYTLLVNLATRPSRIDIPSYFSIQSGSGRQTHALWGYNRSTDTASPLVMCKNVVENEFFGNQTLPVDILPARWRQFVFTASGDSGIVGHGFVDGTRAAQVLVQPAPPLSGASEIVLGGVVADTTGFEGIVGEVRLFEGVWQKSRLDLEACNWDPRSAWIRRKD